MIRCPKLGSSRWSVGGTMISDMRGTYSPMEPGMNQRHHSRRRKVYTAFCGP